MKQICFTHKYPEGSGTNCECKCSSQLSKLYDIDGEYTVESLFQIAKESKQTNIVIAILRRKPNIHYKVQTGDY